MATNHSNIGFYAANKCIDPLIAKVKEAKIGRGEKLLKSNPSADGKICMTR